jgi:hypothetical protein
VLKGLSGLAFNATSGQDRPRAQIRSNRPAIYSFDTNPAGIFHV